MRFLAYACPAAPDGEGAAESSGPDPAAHRANGHGGGPSGGPSSHAGSPGSFAYVAVAWHPSGSLYACGDLSRVDHWQSAPDGGTSAGPASSVGMSATSPAVGGIGTPPPPLSEGAPRARRAAVGRMQPLGALSDLGGACATSCAWHPKGETLAVALSQGAFVLVSRSGRVDARVDGAHEGACVCVRWNSDGTALATTGEDGRAKLWSRSAMLRSTVAQAPSAVYACAFGPDWLGDLLAFCCGKDVVVKSVGGGHAKAGAASGAVVDADGKAGGADTPATPHGREGFRAIRWRAHDGVVLALDWSAANGKVVTGGEDGRYKVWDHHGRLLHQSDAFGGSLGAGVGSGGGGATEGGPLLPVTSVAWRPGGEAFAVGTFDALLVCDESGWVMHKASPKAMLSGEGLGPTAGAEASAMASSVLSLAWSLDGTQVGCARGTGDVFAAAILGEVEEGGALSLSLEAPDRLSAKLTALEPTSPGTRGEVPATLREDLHLGERVLLTSVGFGMAVVVTPTKVLCYRPTPERAWSEPKAIDGLCKPDQPLRLLVQAPKCMATVDAAGTLLVTSYEGRSLGRPRFQGMRAELMSRRAVALSDDCVALIDTSDGARVRLFDLTPGSTGGGSGVGAGCRPVEQRRPAKEAKEAAGRAMQGVVRHPQGVGIAEVGLSHYGQLNQRFLAFVDQNRDLWLCPVVDATRHPTKLRTMVEAFAWSADSGALACVSDGKLVVWCVPEAVFLDQDLLPLVTCEPKALGAAHRNEYGSMKTASFVAESAAKIKAFVGAMVTTRHGNGAQVTYMVPGAFYCGVLSKAVQSRQWPKAIQLCRTVARCEGSGPGDRGHLLWACLAAMAVKGAHTETAKTAYASLGQVDKVQFMTHLQAISSEEGRAAELALFKGAAPSEVEDALLAAGLHYRALKLNVRLFRWEQALRIGLKHDLVRVVLWQRRRHLARQGEEERIPAFLEQEHKLAEAQGGDGGALEGGRASLQDADVRARIQQEKNKELQRPSAGRRASVAYGY